LSVPNDLDLLQGAWGIASLEVDSQTMPINVLSEARIVIEGNRFTSTGMGAMYAGTLKLDVRTTPKRVDMTFDVGPEAGSVNRGIYELKAGAWRLCVATRGDVRPTGFATRPGSGFALEMLKRATGKSRFKVAKFKAKTLAATATAEGPSAGTAPATEFDGEWRMVSGVMNGAAMEEALLKRIKRINRGNTSTILAGPRTLLKVEFSTDGSQWPQAIDYLNLEGPSKGKRQLGIYGFEADLLKICMAAPSDVRPCSFDSASGDGRTLTVWKKG
jgi:uncharacterized protein (TIGR03067 family)